MSLILPRFGGGGGTITPDEIRELEAYGVERIYHPDDGMHMGLVEMIEDVVERAARQRVDTSLPGQLEPGDPAGPGQIYNSNRFTMHAQLSAWGFEAVDLGVARDDPGAVRERLLRGAAQADVVLSSGGVSVGEEDHVRDVIEELGRIDLWRIAVKPGKPFAFGAVGDTPFIGLPGNPVSVLVTLLVIARPFLFACQGRGDAALKPLRAPARFRRKCSWREDYLRVRASGDGLELYDNQSSGALFSTAWADGLARQPADTAIEAGDLVEFLPWALFD